MFLNGAQDQKAASKLTELGFFIPRPELGWITLNRHHPAKDVSGNYPA